jgi:hypothetical protein
MSKTKNHFWEEINARQDNHYEPDYHYSPDVCDDEYDTIEKESTHEPMTYDLPF